MDQVKQEQDLQGGQQQQLGQQQEQQQVPPARPTGTLQDMDTNDLVSKRNQILYDQAVKGQQPGLTLMQVRRADTRTCGACRSTYSCDRCGFLFVVRSCSRVDCSAVWPEC
jgi:hypothetical protein